MYSLKNLLAKSPIQITVAVISVVNFVKIMHWVAMTGDQISALNMALISVLGLFVASKTSNKAVLSELAEGVEPDHAPPQ